LSEKRASSGRDIGVERSGYTRGRMHKYHLARKGIDRKEDSRIDRGKANRRQ
jgi:hypothetical protein